MRNLKAQLRIKLKNARRVALLGIGSDLRADDAAGLEVCAAVETVLKKKRRRCLRHPSVSDVLVPRRCAVFYGHTAPENVTGEIRRFAPSHTIIIDAADFGLSAGKVSVVDLSETGGVSCSTHRLPMAIFADYLVRSLCCTPIFIGIQPATLEFGMSLSVEVRQAVRNVSRAIVDALNEKKR
jgi:hydrogenase 3 maturation protease